jgi:hypothetical protein
MRIAPSSEDPAVEDRVVRTITCQMGDELLRDGATIKGSASAYH